MILLAIGGSLLALPAAAHPHVFVDARTELVFDQSGKITSVRHIWQFDAAFSAFAVQGLDKNGDGKLDDDELQPLAKVNVDSLQEYDFFTILTMGKQRQTFVPPKEYWLQFVGGRLTLFYTLPLKQPVAMTGKATLEIFDPEYFVAFNFPKNVAVKLDGAPKGCTSSIQPPHELDAQTMAQMAAVPKGEDMPPALIDAAAGLASLIIVSCK
jgi:ABC-type uncharacterized transport system substrate-binding protein